MRTEDPAGLGKQGNLNLSASMPEDAQRLQLQFSSLRPSTRSTTLQSWQKWTLGCRTSLLVSVCARVYGPRFPK